MKAIITNIGKIAIGKILGRNQDFPKGYVWEGKSLFKVPGRKGFGEEFEFSNFFSKGSLIFDNLQRLLAFQT